MAPPNYKLMVGGVVPVIERFWDTRVAAAVIGPGLTGGEAAKLPKAAGTWEVDKNILLISLYFKKMFLSMSSWLRTFFF